MTEASRKERIDRLLLSRKLADSRTRAQGLVMAGRVFADGARVDKAGTMVRADASLEVRGEPSQWVSRGAFKLLKGLDVFGVSPEGRVCVDIGASTGGFTQVLLAKGARKVYAVDVGYGQLAWSLRQDGRVVSMERTNARNLGPGNFPEEVGLAVADVSFISLKIILPVMDAILAPGGEVVVLVKPQFEAGRDRVGKNGVVRSPEDHLAVLEDILSFCLGKTALCPDAADFSPVTGPKGNIEYLLHLVKKAGPCPAVSPAETVEKAHEFFKGRKREET